MAVASSSVIADKLGPSIVDELGRELLRLLGELQRDGRIHAIQRLRLAVPVVEVHADDSGGFIVGEALLQNLDGSRRSRGFARPHSTGAEQRLGQGLCCVEPGGEGGGVCEEAGAGARVA